MSQLNADLIRQISLSKNEPKWMLGKRLQALEIFYKFPLPHFGPSLKAINLDKIDFYKDNKIKKTNRWADIPQNIKNTFDKLGIPQAERKFLAGVGTQVDSQIIYQNFKKKWQKMGIIFEDMDTAVQKYPQLVKKYFMNQCVSAANNKFAALHGAVWSGGSFVYIPKGIKLEEPLQGYFFLKSRETGQFEHTLIVAEAGSEVTYIEGCSAPQYSQDSLHSGAVEIFVGQKAKVTYLSIQNWSKNVYNLNTKRALVEAGGAMEWIAGSFGSKVTMLYPTSVLLGRKARASHLSITAGSFGQSLDTGGKVIHLAPETTSTVVSKSVAQGDSQLTYRGGVKIAKNARKSKTQISCESLLLGQKAQVKTYPSLEIGEKEVEAYHEAKTGKIAEEELFYLMSRGLTEKEAISLIVNGFFEPIVAKFPLEYAVELNRLIDLEMEGSVG